MKTIEGNIPQFEDSWMAGQNKQLRDYFAERKCANCTHFSKSNHGCYHCDGLTEDLGRVRLDQNPAKFSCAAFEAKR